MKFIQKFLFVLRWRYYTQFVNSVRTVWFKIQGMKIGNGTKLPKIYATWPHQVSLGVNCVLEHDIYFHYDGIWKKSPSIVVQDDVFIGFGCEFNISNGIVIDRYCNIASGCKFIDHNHGMDKSQRIGPQPSVSNPIYLHEDVWLGVNVVVLMGASIGKGSVVAAGSVVTKSIPPFEIWGGVPAKKIKDRL